MQELNPDPDAVDSSISVYVQVGERSVVQDVTLELLCQIMDKDMYSVLRTQEQLGYVVAGVASNKWQVGGVRFLIQGVMDPEYLEVSLHTYTHTSAHTHTHTYTHTHTRIHKLTHTYMYTHINTHTITHRTRTQMHAPLLCTHTNEAQLKLYVSLAMCVTHPCHSSKKCPAVRAHHYQGACVCVRAGV